MCPDSEPRPSETPRTRAFRATSRCHSRPCSGSTRSAWPSRTPGRRARRRQLEQFLGATAEPERSALLGRVIAFGAGLSPAAWRDAGRGAVSSPLPRPPR